MRKLIVLALVGLAAQLVDGALGMAYGVTSTTLLLVAGIAPASASASVHLAEIGTTLTSGVAHWRFGNVSWPLVAKIAVPGAIGAFLGATLLASLTASWLAGAVAVLLLGLGLLVIPPLGERPPAGRHATGREPAHPPAVAARPRCRLPRRRRRRLGTGGDTHAAHRRQGRAAARDRVGVDVGVLRDHGGEPRLPDRPPGRGGRHLVRAGADGRRRARLAAGGVPRAPRRPVRPRRRRRHA